MRGRGARVAEAASNAHWRDWQSNGQDPERRRMLMLRTVCVLLAVALTAWAFAQLS